MNCKIVIGSQFRNYGIWFRNWKPYFRYPWESAYSGIEVTPGPACGDNEQHITGDVSFALRSYIALTQDFQWLSEVVVGEITPLEFALNMARFWESRPTYNESKRQWEINGKLLFLKYLHKSLQE